MPVFDGRFPKISLLIFMLSIAAICNIGTWFPGMPYGFFTFLRLLNSITSLLCLYHFFRLRWTILLLSGVILLLNNPLFKVSFERSVWNLIDTAQAAYFSIVVVLTLSGINRFRKEGKNNEVVERRND